MPRKPRKMSGTGYYHVVIRGINKQNIFEEEDDFLKLIDVLRLCKAICEFKLYAYCLMNNHIHLLIRVEGEPLEQIFKRIGVRYVGWYNRKYGRTGHLFQDRFKSEAIEDERYLLTVVRYIHQNPVKAGVCADVAKYNWTSYHDYEIGQGITDTDKILGMLSDDSKEALRKFRKLTNDPFDGKCLDVDTGRKMYSDIEGRSMVFKACGANNVAEFQQLSENEQDNAVIALREAGLSIRQIARLTGISVGVVRGK